MTLLSRFLVLRGLRWFPTGLLIPVLVLFVLDRGFTLAEFGAAAAAQSVVVLLLELPTGGLADVIGARRVLLAANVADITSLALLLVADSLPALVAVWALQGVFRALESGPLDAWYVSGALRLDPEVDVEASMSKAGIVSGVALGLGGLLSSGLVIVAPAIGVAPLLLPIAVSVGLRLLDTVAVAVLITDRGATPRSDLEGADADLEGAAGAGPEVADGGAGLMAGVRQVPAVIGAAAGLIRTSTALAALLVIEVLWGIGLVGFEGLFPPRLAEVLDDAERAARLLGPVGTVAWLLAAGGAAVAPALSRRTGPAMAGALLRLAQGATVLGLAVLAGPALLVAAFLATMGIHGASNVIHVGILHANTTSEYRTTVLSANSMAAHLGGGIGSVVLGAVAAGAGLTSAMILAAVVLAAAAPLYGLTRSTTAP